MTWSFSAGGHHNKQYDEWKEDEYNILEDILLAILKEDNIVTRFEFQGNHVSAKSVDEAKEKLGEYNLSLIDAAGYHRNDE